MLRCVLFIVVFLSCLSSSSQSFINELQSLEQFATLSSKPTVKKFSNVQAVKVLHRLKEDKLFFINGNKYHLHFDFAQDELHYSKSLQTFNANNYSDNKYRKFILYNLYRFERDSSLVVEFNVSDGIGFDNMLKAIETLQFSSKVPIKVSLNNNDRIGLKKGFEINGFETLLPNELFANQKTQMVTMGSCKGWLRLIATKEDLFKKNYSNDVLILLVDVLEIPDCKGIISHRFQTPLSHISLLSKNRKIPVIAYPKVLDDETIMNLIDTSVYFAVLEDEFRIEASKASFDVVKRKRLKIKSSDKIKELLPLSKIGFSKKKAFGTKATNLAELRRVRKRSYETPERAFAIPFYYYKEHLERNQIDLEIQKLLKDSLIYTNRLHRKQQLSRIRKKIKRAPLDAGFVEMVKAQLDTSLGVRRFRFRSSSNAEDLDGFNGAGLYTSKTGIVGDSNKTVEKAIKKVWASAWSLNAFEEREIFGIDQKSVRMGVLVHRSFPNDVMNGVAITKNLYRDYDYGFVFNQQIGEHRVVDNEKETCEQLISYFNTKSPFYNNTNSVEYLSSSSLHQNPILTNKELFDLTQELEKIKMHFYAKLSGNSYKKFALDIEYKIAPNLNGENQLYIKQVRLLSKD